MFFTTVNQIRQPRNGARLAVRLTKNREEIKEVEKKERGRDGLIKGYTPGGRRFVIFEREGGVLEVRWGNNIATIPWRGDRPTTIALRLTWAEEKEAACRALPRRFETYMTREAFKNALCDLRMKRGWSQVDLATVSEVSERTIRKIEIAARRGEKKRYFPLLLHQLATALEVDLIY